MQKEFAVKIDNGKKFCFSLMAGGMLLSLSGLANAQSSQEPVYECTAEEAIVYIQKSTYGIYAPSPIQTPKEFKKAYVEQKIEEGDDSCVTIFTDGSLNEDWKDIVDTVRSFDISVSLGAPDLAAMIEMAKRIVQEELTAALESLGEDICQFLSKDNMERLALGAVNEKAGISSRSLEVNALASEVQDLAYDALDDDVQTLLSEKKMSKEIRTESRAEFKQIRKDLWDNL
tara:strand:+ start:29783 stop:30472 length:690 start_codon:yes stop_codon:yes gene_type:complete